MLKCSYSVILGGARKHNVSKINGFALKIMMFHICSCSTLQLKLFLLWWWWCCCCSVVVGVQKDDFNTMKKRTTQLYLQVICILRRSMFNARFSCRNFFLYNKEIKILCWIALSCLLYAYFSLFISSSVSVICIFFRSNSNPKARYFLFESIV